MRSLHFTVLIALALSACSPDQQGSMPLEPALTTDGLACTGDPGDRGSALRRAIEGAEDGTTVSLGPCEYFVVDTLREDFDHRQDTLYNAGIRIEGKAGLTIRGAGQGRTVVKFARSVLLGIEIQSHTTDLTIEDLTIAGSIDRPLCEESPELALCYGGRTSDRPNTHGVASTARAEGVRNLSFRRLEVRDLAVGISVGVWGGVHCDYSNATIENNYVHDIHGTYSGSGYGIHVGCATGITIRGNVIERAGRHSIYVGRSPLSNPDGTVLVRNTIIDHGHREWMSRQVSAVAVARSDNVTVMDNTLIRSHTHGISVEFDPSSGLDCTRCVLIGNKFVNVGELEDIWINARSPVWVWANERGPGESATTRDDSGMMRDATAPNMPWEGTEAIATAQDPLSGLDRLYVMQHDRLHVVRPDYGTSPDAGWRDFRYSTAMWPNFVGMAADRETLYVWEGDSLHAVTPQWSNSLWPGTRSRGWSGRGEIASGDDGYLYVMKDAVLHRVDPWSWTSSQWEAGETDARGLGLGIESVYMRLGSAVYALELGSFGSSGDLRLVD